MKYEKTKLYKIKYAYSKGFGDALKGGVANPYALKDIGLQCAYEAGVSDFEAGYKLDLTVFNKE